MTNNRRIVRAAAALSLVAVAAILSACQTVKGAGKDIQYAGEKTEEAILKSK
jgi:predicted small secreted protein